MVCLIFLQSERVMKYLLDYYSEMDNVVQFSEVHYVSEVWATRGASINAENLYIFRVYCKKINRTGQH